MPHWRTVLMRISPIALLSCALACDGNSLAVQAPPNADAGLTKPAYGSITVGLREASEGTAAYSLVSGTLYGGPRPNPEPLETVTESNGCRLRRALHPFCSEPCGSAAACIDTDTCLPYPEPRDFGNIRVDRFDRVAGGEAVMEPFAPNFFYQSDKLPYPPCTAGRQLQLAATGFTATAPCIAPLRVASSTPLVVRADEPLTIQWQETAAPDLARIEILLDISHHGGKRGDIVCEVDDSGSHTIPAALVSALIEMGTAGFPSVIVSRVARRAASLQGVDFVVQSTVQRPVDTGVQSCLQDTDCPDGRTCDRATVTCR
jgi:hypothetical protein